MLSIYFKGENGVSKGLDYNIDQVFNVENILNNQVIRLPKENIVQTTLILEEENGDTLTIITNYLEVDEMYISKIDKYSIKIDVMFQN